MQDAFELAAKIFQFHCRTNIWHSVFTFKPRIQIILIADQQCDLFEGLLRFVTFSPFTSIFAM
ncbi:MAG: hypothetical protein OFPII_32140 [Osedax symbiont Rs1]|nr:MAG: hypothetical protein OFPII_32140 [Osedax symbiont Rs1]